MIYFGSFVACILLFAILASLNESFTCYKLKTMGIAMVATITDKYERIVGLEGGNFSDTSIPDTYYVECYIHYQFSYEGKIWTGRHMWTNHKDYFDDPTLKIGDNGIVIRFFRNAPGNSRIVMNREQIFTQGILLNRWDEEDEVRGKVSYVSYQFSYKNDVWVGQQTEANTNLQIGNKVNIRFLPSLPTISAVLSSCDGD